MPVLIEKAKTFVKQFVTCIEIKMELLRDKLGAFLGIHPVYKGIVYSPEEEELISLSADTLLEFFPEEPGLIMLGEDFESRCEVIEDIGNRLIEIYGLTGCKIIITDERTEFEPSQTVLTRGQADFEENCVYINANCLYVNDDILLGQIICTLIHELRHIMQYQIATLKNKHGVSYDRRHIWRRNIINYIDATDDMEGYYNQPVEFDARNFAGRVWQMAYNLD